MNSHSLNRLFFFTAFALGLAAIVWVGAGFVGSSAFALAMTVLIGGVYLLGAQEVWRYRQTTASLAQALADVPQPLATLADWLERVPAGLRNAVRLRVEGERTALPAPVLTPYLVGLLVLLGMLGTLLGMMVTLRGTGLALEGATDIDAIRGSLAAPVKGLGFAFGTSIAGVAASAILGLLSALSRRERVLVAQRLDDAIATSLHVHSQSFQREQSFRLLQQQAALMPELVERLQAMVAGIERQTTDAAAQQAALAERAGATVVRHPVNLGQGAALQTGIEAALLDPAAVGLDVSAFAQVMTRAVVSQCAPPRTHARSAA